MAREENTSRNKNVLLQLEDGLSLISCGFEPSLAFSRRVGFSTYMWRLADYIVESAFTEALAFCDCAKSSNDINRELNEDAEN